MLMVTFISKLTLFISFSVLFSVRNIFIHFSVHTKYSLYCIYLSFSFSIFFLRSIDRCENGSWFNHVLEWWQAAQADPEHVLFLHYEQMVADIEGNIRKIADFAGIDHTPEIIAKVSPS